MRKTLSATTIKKIMRLSKQGIPQREIAKKCNVTVVTVNKYAKGVMETKAIKQEALQEAIKEEIENDKELAVVEAKEEAKELVEYAKKLRKIDSNFLQLLENPYIENQTFKDSHQYAATVKIVNDTFGSKLKNEAVLGMIEDKSKQPETNITVQNNQQNNLSLTEIDNKINVLMDELGYRA